MQTNNKHTIKSKIMKNLIILIAAIIILPATTFSQNDEIRELFEKYKNEKYFSVQIALDGDDINLGLDNDMEDLFNNVNDIYILKFRGNDYKDSKLVEFQNNFKSLVDKDNFKPMIEVSSEDDNLKILLKRQGNDDPVEVIFIKEDDNTAMYLYATK